MRLATEPQASQAALERALRALTQLVCARHKGRQARGEHSTGSGLLLDLAQVALWLAVQAALQGEDESSALFPSLLSLPTPRRAELLGDVDQLLLAVASWRTEPSGPLATERGASVRPEDEVGRSLTKAAHAARLEALAAWVCGADALDELELALASLLASVGVLELGTPAPAAPGATFAALVTRARMQWSGPAPKLGAEPAPVLSARAEPAPVLSARAEPAPGPDASGRHSATGRISAAPGSRRTDPARRERRFLLAASLGTLTLLALALLTWILSQPATRDALQLPAAASDPQASDALQKRGPLQRRVRIYSRPTRAQLFLDDRFIGLTPLELERDQASGNLRLSLEGYPDLRQEIDLRQSTSSVLVLELGGR